MSLIRQIWLLLVSMVLMAFLGSFLVWMMSSRTYLETQLRMKNNDNAQSLALSLSQQHGDHALMELVISAQFDTGNYQYIKWYDPQGKLEVQDLAYPVASKNAAVPHWFERLIAIESVPGVAQLSDGWRPLGRIEVVSHTGFAYAELWYGSLQTALWLSALGLVAGGFATWGLSRIKRPLDATIEQAQALVERRFITVKEPKVPELARLTRAMNTMVVRMKSVFEEQLAQVEQLRIQAHCDPLSGVSHRSYFLTQLSATLARKDIKHQGALILVRLLGLSELNQRLGHQRTDRLLRELAQTLSGLRQGLVGEAVGRLNGSDFALYVADVRNLEDFSHAVSSALANVCTQESVQAAVVVAGVLWRPGMSVAQLLALADEQLARAESQGPFAVQTQEQVASEAVMRGQAQWRSQLTLAKEERLVRLRGQALVDRQERLIHEEQNLLLQLEQGGAYEADAYWRALAHRTGQLVELIELSIALSVDAIVRDDKPRSVSIATACMSDVGFVARLRSLLEEQPSAAQRLSLDVAESVAVERFELLSELSKQLRPLGVRMGLEHAGERLTRIEQLMEAGLDYVKLDAAIVHGVAQDDARLAHVKSLIHMLHALELRVYAQSLEDEQDVQALWSCGLDGIVRPDSP